MSAPTTYSLTTNLIGNFFNQLIARNLNLYLNLNR